MSNSPAARQRKAEKWHRRMFEANQRADQFWMIAGSQGPSKKRYRKEIDATIDAIELAKLHPGHKFHVVAALGWVEADESGAVSQKSYEKVEV